jgi:hypothetical protein
MLYLGIDQHRKQLTVSVRNEEWIPGNGFRGHIT